MYITGFEEIINVWSNDAYKLSLFLYGLSLFLMAFIFFSFKKDLIEVEFKKSILDRRFIKIFFSIITLVNSIAIAGVGQIILDPLYDSIVRSVGIFFYMAGLILYILLFQECREYKNISQILESRFFKLTRNPDMTLLLLILIGSSLLTISFFGILFTLLLFMPILIFRMRMEGKELTKSIKSYYDYSVDIPVIFPDFIRIARRALNKRK